jgi:hypothetical protein
MLRAGTGPRQPLLMVHLAGLSFARIIVRTESQQFAYIPDTWLPDCCRAFRSCFTGCGLCQPAAQEAPRFPAGRREFTGTQAPPLLQTSPAVAV